MCRLRNKCLGVPITCRPSFSLFLSSGHIQNCAGAVCSHSLEPIVEVSAVVQVRRPHIGSLISTHPEGRVFTMLYTMKSMLRSQLSSICQHIMDYISCWIYNWMKYALHHFRTFTLWTNSLQQHHNSLNIITTPNEYVLWYSFLPMTHFEHPVTCPLV